MEAIKTGLANVSPENPESRYKGTGFDELVASVKEKGVLMPILVRPLSKKGIVRYEVVAGARRLMAAQLLGIEEIPARIVEMTDTEAREARIIENLQREDIHPLDEAAAYALLRKGSKPELAVEEIAAKVGKSATYVRGRLALVNLSEKIASKVRADEFPLAHATVIARLPAAEQARAFKFATQYGRICELPTLREFIQEDVLKTAMQNPPWKDDASAKAEIAKVVGVEDTGSKNLFGETLAETFDDPAQHARAMAAWLTLKKNEYAAAGKTLVLISGDYRTTTKGVIGRGSYSEDRVKGCKTLEEALVIEGSGIGKVMKICRDKSCKAHHPYQYERADTPEQEARRKANRKKEIETEKAKREKDTKAMTEAVARVKWPLTEKQLNGLVTLAINRAAHDVHQGIVKRRELEAKKEKNYHGRNYKGAVEEAAKHMTAKEKAGLLFELLVPGYSPHYTGGRTTATKLV